MRRRQIKKEIFTLLKHASLKDIYKKIKSYPEVGVVNSLFMALCDQSEIIRWHGVSCFGEVVFSVEKENTEKARVIMRRFLWSLNDESGGIGWGAPESMAETMVRSDRLRREYLHMLISYMQEDGDELFQDGNFLELPLLQKGLLWGIGRLCHSFPAEMQENGVDLELLKYLSSTNQEVRDLALWAMSGFGKQLSDGMVIPECHASSTLRLYIDGIFHEIDMAELYNQLRSYATN